MVTINGHEITMTRGDTLNIALMITDDTGAEYQLLSADRLIFRLARNFDETILVTKTLNNSSPSIVLEPADTKSLSYGAYVYEVEMTSGSTVDTIIAKGKLILDKEVG